MAERRKSEIESGRGSWREGTSFHLASSHTATNIVCNAAVHPSPCFAPPGLGPARRKQEDDTEYEVSWSLVVVIELSPFRKYQILMQSLFYDSHSRAPLHPCDLGSQNSACRAVSTMSRCGRLEVTRPGLNRPVVWKEDQEEAE